MNNDNPVLHRDQIKRPNFQRFINSNSNGLSSPFPFMEFGLNSQSSLNNIIHNISRENGNSNVSSQKLDNQNKKISNLDPYLKPLNLDRLRTSNTINRENNNLQFSHNFIKLSSNNLKSNEFSENLFLRLQSTRTDSAENFQKKLNGVAKTTDSSVFSKQSNDVNKLILENRPITAVLTPNSISKKESQLQTNFSGLSRLFPENSYFKDKSSVRPITATPILKSSNNINFTSNTVNDTENSSKFYVKSFKTDALIYNPNKKSPSETTEDKPQENQTSLFKNSNSQSLYLQVKQEVEEYRKQRRKEAMLDVDIQSNIKVVSADEMFGSPNQNSNIEAVTNKNSLSKISGIKSNSDPNLDLKIKYKTDRSSKDIAEITQNKSPETASDQSQNRPKSVTFNDTVETRDFVDESSSESENEESNAASSSDDESRGSIVSTESESEGSDQVNDAQESNTPFKKTIIETELTCAPENKDKSDTDPLLVDENKNIELNNKSDDQSDSNEEDSENEDLTTTDVNSYKSDSETEKVIKKPEEKSKPNLSSRSSQARSASVVNSSISSTGSSSASKSQKKPFQESKTKINGQYSKQDILEMSPFKDTRNHLPLIFSKFSNVPPVINFVGDGEKIEQLPWQLRKLLRWRTSLLTPIIVKQTISRSGFRPSRYTSTGDDLDDTESNDWILYFGKHMKGPVFKTIKDYQKVNHFPGSFQLGRKDRLWRNIYRLQQEIGQSEFDFIPQTFCLPTDLELFKQCWESGGSKHKWIIKPPASARGIGVKVVHKWNQIPKRRPVIVQKYISNPYLINESKFDLRLYVFITDINPLRIYLYEDGLVRFASTKYTNSVKSLHNRFIHLTNYSINKQNIEYLDNNDSESCKGHKWSLKTLWRYLKKRGVNTDHVWHKIKDLVIKTIISAEEAINASVNVYCKSGYSVQELFGFDIILDDNLKPWILEVNVSPSLHSDSPLDIIIKGGMIKDMLNLSGFTLPEPSEVDTNGSGTAKSPINQTFPTSDLFIDRRFWVYEQSEDEKAKMKHFVSLATNGTDYRFDSSDNIPYQILDCLTPKDVRYLVQCLDEFERKGHFERIYPLCSIVPCKKYLSYFERIHYPNLLVAAFLTKFSRNNQGIRLLENLCQKKLHLKSAVNGDKIDARHVWKTTSYSGDNY